MSHWPTPGRAAADLGEAQALRAEEPLHVRRRRCRCRAPSITRAAHLLDLVVARLVHAVGGDDLRRDPAGAHRLEHVRVVVADEVVGDAAVDRQRVVEALVALDELLDRHRRAVGERRSRAATCCELARRCRRGRCPTAPAASRGLRITGKPTAATKSRASRDARRRRPRRRSARRRGAAPPSSPPCRGRDRRCAPRCRGCVQRSRTCAAGRTCASTTASSRSTHIRPWTLAHRPFQRALVGDRARSAGSRRASPSARRRASRRAARRRR